QDDEKGFARGGKGDGAGSIAESGFPKTHVIEKGDSFWTIADRYYKKGILWPQIEKANPGVKVIPGKTLTIPEPVIPVKRVATSRNLPDSPPEPGIPFRPETGPGPTRKTPPVAPRRSATEGMEGGMTTAREYRVQKGDTLSSLAKRFYRDAHKSYLIEEANTNLRYQVLREGSTIRIPAEK
ncbi:MAG TPA: LysM peptidoglycan-binding domain-containing protein, partial [Planctomycetota bacterium]|nr:LysM peptidoglycan-binding domain-containing protein [Planctomycetota bacterium]